MRRMKRELAQMELQQQMRAYRKAGVNRRPSDGWLCAVRQALGLPVEEIARHLKLSEKMVFQLERSEERKTISIERLESAAKAMKCDLVYGIVPWDRSLQERAAEIADRGLWKKRFAQKGW